MTANIVNSLPQRKAAIAFLPIVLLTPWLGFAQQLPKPPIIAPGVARFLSTGSNLVVTNRPGTPINWQSFNIGTGNTARFVQQSANSMVFNRVAGGNPSGILGVLVPTDKTFVLNPNGAAPQMRPLDLTALSTKPFLVITSDGAFALGTLPPPPSAATQVVRGADGVLRLTSKP